MSCRTDGAARAEPNIFELCRVVTEEDESQRAEIAEIFLNTDGTDGLDNDNVNVDDNGDVNEKLVEHGWGGWDG